MIMIMRKWVSMGDHISLLWGILFYANLGNMSFEINKIKS